MYIPHPLMGAIYGSWQPADAAKKPKLVGNSDNAYSFLPAVAPGTTPDTNIGMAHNGLLARSAATRLYASTRDKSYPTLVHPRHVSRADRFPVAPSLASPARTSACTMPPNFLVRSHPTLPVSRTPPRLTTPLARISSTTGITMTPTRPTESTRTPYTPVPQAAPTPRKLFVPLPRLLRGAVFPTLPVSTLPDVFHAILDAPKPRTHPTKFVFEWTPAAAANNLAVPRRYAGDLRAALAAQPFSTLSPGSKFRPAYLLAPLLSCHPYGRHSPSALPTGQNSPF